MNNYSHSSTPQNLSYKLKLPQLHLLKKDKKYKYHQKQNTNPVKIDIDDVIASISTKPPSYHLAQTQKNNKVVNQKIAFSASKFIKSQEVMNQHPLLLNTVKQLKSDIRMYTRKLGEPQQYGQGDYPQFVKLSRQSQDYLEYYLKNHFKQTNLEVLQRTDKSIILSQLKNTYPCLTNNPPQIVARILLALNINPLNDFHLVPWNSFSQLRKLCTLRHTKNDGRKFVVNYLLSNKKVLKKEQFWAIICTLLRKFEIVLNQNNVERLIQRTKHLSDQWIPQQLNKLSLHNLLVSNKFFIWQQLIEVMFLV